MTRISNIPDFRWSRRELLAGALGTVAFARAVSAWQAGVRRYCGLPMGVHGASFAAFPIDRAIAMLAELGLNRLEVSTAQIRLVEIRGALHKLMRASSLRHTRVPF